MKGESALTRKTFGYVAAIIIAIVLTMVPTTGCSPTSDDMGNDDIQTTSTITDMAGREVSVKTPVERIVLASSRHLHEFAAVGGAEVIDQDQQRETGQDEDDVPDPAVFFIPFKAMFLGIGLLRANVFPAALYH